MAMAREPQRFESVAEWVGSPVGWAAVTAAAGAVAYVVIQPSTCADVPQCAAKHSSISTNLNTYAAYGLMMVLVGETANLISTYRGAQEAQSMIADLRSRCLPSLLLVVSFLVLICESGTYASESRPWFSSNRPDLEEPVFTATFVEWLVLVPMLLVMAGSCALGRPLEELGRPIMVTNVYIIMSWAALLTTSMLLRWCLVTATFGMYFWASWDMIMWVGRYLQAAPAELSSRLLRPCLSLGLIALFAIYAVVYMAVLLGAMAPKTERVTFLFLNVGSKLCFSIAFVVIRGNEYHSTLTGVLRKLSTSNVAVVSILRGSFDILLPCMADAKGQCVLPMADSGDMAQLEHALQRPVAGLAFADLMPDKEESARFAAYVRNSHRQAQAAAHPTQMQAVGAHDWAVQFGSALPPVAQVLNCHLVAATTRVDVGGQPAPALLACAVHLSVVPSSSSSGRLTQMVAAVRFTEESTVTQAGEAAAQPGFKAFNEVSSACSTRTSSQLDCQSEFQYLPDGRMVASLTDVARLGMSALLRSNHSVSGDDEAESGYNDGSSYVNVKPQQKQNPSLPGENVDAHSSRGARSTISEESGNSASVLQLPANPKAKKLKSAPSVGSSQTLDMQRLATLVEPEEEQFSRNTTPLSLQVEEQPQKPNPPSHHPTDEKCAKVAPAGSTFASLGTAVTAALQGFFDVDDPVVADPKSNVTVTMRVSHLQFGVAAGVLALAATVSLLSRRRSTCV